MQKMQPSTQPLGNAAPKQLLVFNAVFVPFLHLHTDPITFALLNSHRIFKVFFKGKVIRGFGQGLFLYSLSHISCFNWTFLKLDIAFG